MPKAFDGVRIVDFTQVLCGPMATAQLALLGADVVKIEQPGVGDQMRMLSADDIWAEKMSGPAYMGVNYAKRSITIDLKNPAAKDIVGRLVKGANAVVENFKPGVMSRLGFDYDWAKSIQPDIIYCAISGFGQEGPMKGTGAYDGAIQAVSGMMTATGTPETGPMRIGFPVADMTTGMNAAFAISTALYRQKATGEGQRLDLSMTDSVLSLLNYWVSRYLVAGEEPELFGNDSPTKQGTSGVFPTKDGHLNVSVFTDKMAMRLCDALGHPEWKEAPRYMTTAGRMDALEAIQSEIKEILATETTREWMRRMEVAGVPAAPVNTLHDALHDEQMDYRGFLLNLPAPTGIDREIRLPGTSFIASEDSPGTDRPPPLVGEHTEEILGEIGYGADDIAAFRDDGVI